ncbi:Tubulin-tyrosine ligase family [Nesidiocoris tenuis]|uniref:Tubulin-tyrosine ligase family n=1 Tax=Nesidiocoris tenuis TaxID=355587 RepID=A0ABN7AEA5_9HEMI|nr:Tubulin-tyrosine ligase family [Nesidiocoris tenuis]
MGIFKTVHKTWLNFKMLCRRLTCNQFSYVVIIVIAASFVIFLRNYGGRDCPPSHVTMGYQSEPQTCNATSTPTQVLRYAVYGRQVDSGHLRHVFETLSLYGYQRVETVEDDWHVLWSHDYPFQRIAHVTRNLKPYQKVNHFPGTGFITNKMDLSTTGLKFSPVAFRIPEQKKELINYAANNPSKMFVQKSNDHRGIQIKNLDDIELDRPGSFVQEFVANPLLIDGYKFDIGVYTTVTSFDPLRVYIYNGDALLRYCPEKYYPFDPSNLDKYVIGDDYLPTWEVPALKDYYTTLGYSMKDAFDGYLIDSGRNPKKIWEQIEDAIREVCLSKEPMIMKYLSTYKSKRNFFEMMRFDFVVDDNLNVFVMEVNMSPNLSSAHFLENQVLYEQVLFNLFSLVGLGTFGYLKNDRALVSDKNLMVSPSECAACGTSCTAPECHLCKPCLTPQMKLTLKDAYLEHMNRRDCKRIYPVENVNQTVFTDDDLGPENRLMKMWFKKKCISDPSWC